MKRSIVVRVVAGVIANTVLGAFIAPARAADVPMPAPYAPVARPLYSWTGCYGGVNIGGGSANKTFTDVNGTLDPAGGTLGSHTARGVVGGGQGGCDYQTGMFLFGIAAMLDASGIKGTNSLPNGILTDNSYMQWFATATARAGVLAAPTLLFYGKAGGAWAHDLYNISSQNSSFTFTILNRPVNVPSSSILALGSASPSGWTAGAGLEWAFFGGAFTAFLEYDYMSFGTMRVNYTAVVVSGLTFPIDVRQSVNLILFGINYRFGAGGRSY